MIFSKKRESLVVKWRLFVLTSSFPALLIQLRDGSIFSYYHRVDLSKFRLEHGNCCYLLPVIPKLISYHFSATALQSLEIACDTILSGKAKVMIAGGFDDISEEGSYEFANMKATSNAETEFAMGREPTEMSRPATTSRAGVSCLI